MIKKYEAWSEDNIDKDLYIGNSINKPKPEVVPANKSFLTKIKDKIYKSPELKEKIKNLKWSDLILKRPSSSTISIKLPLDMQNSAKTLYDFSDLYFALESYNLVNRIHLYNGLPKDLRGLNLGYKAYKAMAMHMGYIASTDNASDQAKYVWKYLVQDPDFYSILTDGHVLLIDKKLPKEKIMFAVICFLKEYYTMDEITEENLLKLSEYKNKIRVDPELANYMRDYDVHKLNYQLYNRLYKMKKEH